MSFCLTSRSLLKTSALFFCLRIRSDYFGEVSETWRFYSFFFFWLLDTGPSLSCPFLFCSPTAPLKAKYFAHRDVNYSQFVGIFIWCLFSWKVLVSVLFFVEKNHFFGKLKFVVLIYILFLVMPHSFDVRRTADPIFIRNTVLFVQFCTWKLLRCAVLSQPFPKVPRSFPRVLIC